MSSISVNIQKCQNNHGASREFLVTSTVCTVTFLEIDGIWRKIKDIRIFRFKISFNVIKKYFKHVFWVKRPCWFHFSFFQINWINIFKNNFWKLKINETWIEINNISYNFLIKITFDYQLNMKNEISEAFLPKKHF